MPSSRKDIDMALDFVTGSIRRSEHRGDDDLLSAGLGLAGVAGLPVRFADPAQPTAAELRRRAIQTGWKGIADLGPLGGFGRLYGAVPDVPGREYSAFARFAQARHPHRVLCQVPDAFDARARCLVVAPSSGSRGIYGAMALAGGWALPRGCAVVYTDKGTGSGYFDCASGTGVALDGTRVAAGSAMLEFEPAETHADAGIAVKHAHSGDHPEADWGAHVLQAVEFGLAMLDEAFPEQAPFTPANTRIIAVGISNGGAAVLQAAGVDRDGWLDGVVAIEPNVQAPVRGRALYDYASEAALWMPAALTAARFAGIPFTRAAGLPPPAWAARRGNLHERGLLPSGEPAAAAEAARDYLHASGWCDEALATAATSVAFDLWRAVAVTYSSAYLRAGVGAMPCGFAFRPVEVPAVPAPVVRAAWWADGSGIPPDVGIGVFGGLEASTDPTLPGVLALRELWDGDADAAATLRAAVAKLDAGLPREGLPIWIVHGAEDGLIPTAFSSDIYVDWLREQGREPRYWRVPHAQHFDAFLQLPAFGDRYVPLLPYGYVALDRMYAHVVQAAPLADLPTPQPRPRGARALELDNLDLPR
ncbi:MAG TPA: 3-hydroxybutyrate oligomer hydrolase family protein [Rhodanobacteraceae bacterium]|nr:3-hydroxybutyrate oligomer hydrolase family protein [Rhodanobacteraceae bacterium]